MANWKETFVEQMQTLAAFSRIDLDELRTLDGADIETVLNGMSNISSEIYTIILKLNKNKASMEWLSQIDQKLLAIKGTGTIMSLRKFKELA